MAGKKKRKPTNRPRANAIVTGQRVSELLRIRLDGAERWDVLEYVRQKEQEAGSAWEVPEGGKPLSESMIWYLLTKADTAIHDSHNKSRKRLRRRHMAQSRNLYAKAVLAGDLRTALACQQEEAELMGLYPPKKTEQSTKLTGDVNVNHVHKEPLPKPDAVAALIAGILDRSGPPADRALLTNGRHERLDTPPAAP